MLAPPKLSTKTIRQQYQCLTKMVSVGQAKKIVLYLAVIPDAGFDSRPAWRTINIARVRRTKYQIPEENLDNDTVH